MKASHTVVMELLNCSDDERRERVKQIFARDDDSATTLTVAIEEVLSGNDVEGAAIAIAALNATYPDHEADEYLEARNRFLDQTCPLHRLLCEPDLPAGLERMALEMLDIIDDGAARLTAGFPLVA